MTSQLSQEQQDWRERFHAVASAQSRYLYLMLLAGLFFAALAEQQGWTYIGCGTQQELSFIGIKLHSGTLLAAGPAAIALLILAALGTFPALWYAFRRLRGDLGKDERPFERIDSVPTAIDFVVYPYRPPRTRLRLGMLAYPTGLWLGYAEAAWLGILGLKEFAHLSSTQRLLIIVGTALLIRAIARMVVLSWMKIRVALGLRDESDWG